MFLSGALFSHAQWSNLHTKKIKSTGIVQLDKHSIVPNSIVIKDIDTNFYVIDYLKATLSWKKKPSSDSVLITYRTFPLSFTTPAYRFNYDSIRNNFLAKQPYLFTDNDQNLSNNLFNFGSNITYNGSFGRSLSFGNSQDAVFNSQLNLQLSGYLADSIQIAAAITDNNIPIQPDGTTQQLNEFDKLLIQFKKNNWELNLGDIDVRQRKNYYLNFYKRLQGMSFSNQSPMGVAGTNKLLLSGAIAKGKFTRNVFQGLEGNQGPYRLQGANSELYFVVLANTEHVFIDGELLQRGEDQDYIINYNTAEITFMPRRLITKDRRIQVEFEYADRNFLNSLLFVNDELQLNKKFSVSVGAYQNADAKNSPINQSLDPTQTRFLANLGNNIQNAFYPIASVDTFSAARIMYARTALPNGKDSLYYYSVNPDSAHYLLNFVEVGTNKGNYIPFLNGANGKVYQYIAPINDVPQGNFEPATFLVTPKKQQVFNVSTTYAINPKTTLQTDMAVSNYDVNTFSTKDKTDNTGMAGRFLLVHTGATTLFHRHLFTTSNAGYEYNDRQFKPIERLRSVEFARDWGLPLTTNTAAEHLPSLGFEWKDSDNNALKYTAAGYLRSDAYKGFRQALQNNIALKNWQFKTDISLVNSTSPNSKGLYFRPSFDVSKAFPSLYHVTVGGGYSLENNSQHTVDIDSLSTNSFYFDVASAYLKSNPVKLNKWAFTYTTRSDKAPVQASFLQLSRSYNYNFMYDLMQNKNQQLHLNMSYRQLQISNKNLSNLAADNTLLGRVEYNFHSFSGLIVGNSLYELGSGQEQQRDITYVEVAAGRGQYTWIDYNNDGIQQLNEFEIARFSDQAKFVRIYTPTNLYVKSNYTQFNYSISVNPRAISSQIINKKWNNILTRFNLQSTLQTGQKVLAENNPLFNPFDSKIADAALISLNYLFNNTLSFNRFSAKWGVDLSKVVNYHKNLLTYGAQSTQLNEWSVKARGNINRKFSLEVAQKLGNNNMLTPSFANQNYALTTSSTEPKFSFINATLFRIQAGYQYLVKRNAPEFGGETSISNSLTLETKYNAVQNTSITGKFTFNNIRFDGSQNTAVSYIMLDGLLAGKNFLWTIEYTKRLINNLELNFSYEGRKPGNTQVINIGRASLRVML